MALPVLTGCALCGLEFSFWQNATSESGELLALLPLVAAVWLLLEFNVRQDLRWLDAAAVVWGLGMAENWVMILALPLLVGAILALRRLAVLRPEIPPANDRAGTGRLRDLCRAARGQRLGPPFAPDFGAGLAGQPAPNQDGAAAAV